MSRELAVAIRRAPTGVMIKETVALVGIAAAVPFLIHLIPSAGVPWGARLLPMFYAPLLGVMLYRFHVGLIPALLAPALNVLLTGSPALSLVTILTVELVLFTAVVFLMLKSWPRLWLAGPFAYMMAKAGSGVMIATLPWFSSFRPAGRFALASVETAIPGLLVLTALTVLMLRIRSDQTGHES